MRELVFWEKGVSPSTKTTLSSFTVLKLLIWVIRYGSSDAEFQGENFGTKISKISKMELYIYSLFQENGSIAAALVLATRL